MSASKLHRSQSAAQMRSRKRAKRNAHEQRPSNLQRRRELNMSVVTKLRKLLWISQYALRYGTITRAIANEYLSGGLSLRTWRRYITDLRASGLRLEPLGYGNGEGYRCYGFDSVMAPIRGAVA